MFHRQKLKKAVITLSIDENYELNDSGCYRTHRLEENLYEDYLPKDSFSTFNSNAIELLFYKIDSFLKIYILQRCYFLTQSAESRRLFPKRKGL